MIKVIRERQYGSMMNSMDYKVKNSQTRITV